MQAQSRWLDPCARYLTRNHARRDIVQYIEMAYSSNRLHSTLGCIILRERGITVAAQKMGPLRFDQNSLGGDGVRLCSRIRLAPSPDISLSSPSLV